MMLRLLALATLVSLLFPTGASAQIQVPAVVASHLPQGAEVLQVVAAGPDTAGIAETAVAYFVRSPDEAFGRVGALVVRQGPGESRVFHLAEELGEHAFADLQVRDLNGDGATEVAVLGGLGAHSALLSIFRWDGDGYPLLDEFFGDSGLTLRDLDGDGRDEIVVGARHYDRAQLRHDDILAWDGVRYAPSYSRWSFTFERPGFREYPEAAVLSYYLLIAERSYRQAYDLLGGSMQSGQSYDDFQQGFASTRDVRVENLEVIFEEASTATVQVVLSSVEADGSTSHFEGTWIVERVEDGWQLVWAYITPA